MAEKLMEFMDLHRPEAVAEALSNVLAHAAENKAFKEDPKSMENVALICKLQKRIINMDLGKITTPP